MIFSAIIKVVWGEWGDIRRYNSKKLELKVYIKFLKNLYIWGTNISVGQGLLFVRGFSMTADLFKSQ